MAVFLSDDWIAELATLGAALPTFDGADVRCQHEVAGAPDGKVRFYTVWENGVLAEVAKGKIADADVMITVKAPDALDVLRGAKEPVVSFMQGRLKVDGDYRRMLIDLAEWRTSEPYVAMWRSMADATD